jgi:cytochrome c553
MRRVIAALAVILALAQPARAQSFEERLVVCLACHGENGISQTPEVPSLAGMPDKFTLIQIYLFREGRRKIEIMNDVTKGLTDDDLRRFSEYFAKLPPSPAATEQPDPAIAVRAQAVIARTHCASCHNPDFSGREQMPRLAGQREDYLLKSLRDYKAGQRPGYDATMDDVVRSITDADIVDLSHYLARFR